MIESSNVEGGSAVGSPEEDGGGGEGGATPKEDSTLGCLELARI